MTTTGTVFTRPYSSELLRALKQDVNYIYPRQELVSEPIFPYFILDGGAFNLVADRFPYVIDDNGSVNSDKMLELIENDKLFEEFRHGGKYNWERSFASNDGTDGFTRKYEWQIWPQRLYMIIPVAQAFLRTGDEKYSKLWLEIVRGWSDAHPYQEFDPTIHYIKTNMVWRDMQVAWRTLSLLHSVFMLQDAPYSKEDWQFIYSFLNLHANHLYLEAKHQLTINNVQNHALQIGSALITCAVMFPEFNHSDEMLDMGMKVVRMNMAGIMEGGGSNEDSPSYSHFIARLYLETFLLLRNNSIPVPDGLEDSIKSQYQWLWQCDTPKGNSPRISDSYGIDVQSDINRVRKLIDIDLPQRDKSVIFRENNFAVIRKGKLTLYADALDPNGLCSHLHYGRPQMLLYYGEGSDSDVIVDAGCCNYDKWEYYHPIRSTAYHNVLYCPDVNDFKRRLSCRIDEYSDTSVSFSAEISEGGISYSWKRKITVEENRIIIDDSGESEKDIQWMSHLFFSRCNISEPSTKVMRMLSETYRLTVNTEMPYRRQLMPVMNDGNRQDYAIVMECSCFGKNYRNRTVLDFENHTY